MTVSVTGFGVVVGGIAVAVGGTAVGVCGTSVDTAAGVAVGGTSVAGVVQAAPASMMIKMSIDRTLLRMMFSPCFNDSVMLSSD